MNISHDIRDYCEICIKSFDIIISSTSTSNLMNNEDKVINEDLLLYSAIYKGHLSHNNSTFIN